MISQYCHICVYCVYVVLKLFLVYTDHDVHCVNMCDIIAVHPTYRGHWNVHNTTSNHHAKSTEFTAFTFSRMAGRKWNLRKLTFQCPSTEMCRQWLEHLYRLLEGMRHRPKYLKVFINPVGGARKAQKIYDEKVRPLWELAGIRTDITGGIYSVTHLVDVGVYMS